MKRITYTEILNDDPKAYYLLIGYENPAGQLDVAKFDFTLLSSYYINNKKLRELFARVVELSNFIQSCLYRLSGDVSVDNDGHVANGNELCGKITTPELSAYCSLSRFNEMKGERTFIKTEEFMNYIRDNFRLSSNVNQETALARVGKPLSVARNRIEEILTEAYKRKEEE